MTEKKVVIFDWDGTLYDSEGLLEVAVVHALRAMAIPVTDSITTILRNPVEGINTVESVEGQLSNLQAESFRSRIAIDFALLERAAMLKIGMPQILKYLQGEGAVLCVATGRSRRRFEADIKKLALHNMFAVTVCADEGRPKPHGDCLLRIIKTLEVEPGQCVFVGDSQADEQCASVVAMPFIGARIDYRTRTVASGFLSTTNVARTSQALREMLSLWIARQKGESEFIQTSVQDSLKDKVDV